MGLSYIIGDIVLLACCGSELCSALGLCQTFTHGRAGLWQVGAKTSAMEFLDMAARVIPKSLAGLLTMRALQPACHANCMLLEAINLRIINTVDF